MAASQQFNRFLLSDQTAPAVPPDTSIVPKFTCTSPVQSFADSNHQLVEAFERWLLARNYSPCTRQFYSKSARAFAAFLGSDDVRTVGISRLRVFLTEHGRSPGSYQNHRLALRSFYRFLTLAHVIGFSPIGLIRRPKTLRRRLPRCLSERETEQLIAAARSPRDTALIELLYATGLRANEAACLQIKHLDLDAGTLRVIAGKGNKDRRGFIGSKAIEALRAYLGSRHRGPVFLNQHSNPLHRYEVSRIVRDTARRAGLDGVHAHTLRHTMATALLNRDADIRHVQELLGHQRITTTAIYLQTVTTDLARVLEQCHPHGGDIE